MSNKIHLVIAQLNFFLGDIQGNSELIIEKSIHARDVLNADIIVFPELCITSYPPEDLLLRNECQEKVEIALHNIMHQVQGIHLLVGHPKRSGDDLYNAASLIFNGEIIAQYQKQHLPNYGVFDEKRYFKADHNTTIVLIKDIPFGIAICEDLWHPGPLQANANAGAKAILCVNASPYYIKKPGQREDLLRERQEKEGSLPIIYANLVGGQDELIFDGNSFVLDQNGETVARAPAYEEALLPITLDFTEKTKTKKTKTMKIKISGNITPLLDPIPSIYRALVLGTRDYVHKNGFSGALIGSSGGVDSALTLVIACDALGAENVHAVLMPSRFTSEASNALALQLSKNLNVKHSIISIEPTFQAFLESLSDEFKNCDPDITEENIQARCRGVILMALSNKTGKLVLTTGNKSEYAVGYSTLYGDMVGAYAVIKDITKTLVYQLCEYRNKEQEVIPNEIITRKPSAELRENQTDQDTLPPYYFIDEIIHLYVEENQSIDQIVAQGFDEPTVTKIVDMIAQNEYKRRQAAPGVRITYRAFGRDWRYPITSGFNKKILRTS